MSETTIDADQPAADDPVTPVADAPQEHAVETGAEKGPDLTAEVAKWKELSRKNEARAKENADKAKRFDEIEEAAKTEAQRLLERAEKAEKALQNSQREAARANVAAKTGVPVELVHGDTEDQMQAAADVALAFKGKPSPAAPADLVTASGDTTKPKQITSRDELKSMSPTQIIAAKNEGRLDDLLGKVT